MDLQGAPCPGRLRAAPATRGRLRVREVALAGDFSCKGRHSLKRRVSRSLRAMTTLSRQQHKLCRMRPDKWLRLSILISSLEVFPESWEAKYVLVCLETVRPISRKGLRPLSAASMILCLMLFGSTMQDSLYYRGFGIPPEFVF